MLTRKQIEDMNIAFDGSNGFVIARVPTNYHNAEDFALRVVYGIRPYIADKLGVSYERVVLVAISENNKVVVMSENSRYREWLYHHFQKPSIGCAQLYDDVEPKQIIGKLKVLFN